MANNKPTTPRGTGRVIIDLVQQCEDCGGTCELIEYIQMNLAKDVYRFRCGKCGSHFKLITNKRRNRKDGGSINASRIIGESYGRIEARKKPTKMSTLYPHKTLRRW